MSFLKSFEGKMKVAAHAPVLLKKGPVSLVNIDLSENNPDLARPELKTSTGLHTYIFDKIHRAKADGAIGGYAEQRNLYQRSDVFKSGTAHRNIHLGIDVWMPAGTGVCAVLPGRIHSFKNNHSFGDYGPTIIVHHQVGNHEFYTLYGHLSLSSLDGLQPGTIVSAGQKLGALGTSDENVGWPPHLHFQLIRDLQNYKGDYPGVCHAAESDFYLHNCPDPVHALKLSFAI